MSELLQPDDSLGAPRAEPKWWVKYWFLLGVMGVTLGGLAFSWGGAAMTLAECVPYRTSLEQDGSLPSFSLAGGAGAAVPDAAFALHTEDIRTFYRYASCRAELYQLLSNLLPITAILVAFLTTLAASQGGDQHWKLAAVTFGSAATALTTIQGTYPIGAAAGFYADIRTQTNGLLSDITVSVKDHPEKFASFLASLQQLKAAEAKGPAVHQLVTGVATSTPQALPNGPTPP